jgi:hypothetical protein
MALYSEHNTLPESAEIIIDREKKTAEQRYQTPANLWSREVEAEVIMSRDVARSLRDWLSGRLEVADTMEGDADITFQVTSATDGEKYADSN